MQLMGEKRNENKWEDEYPPSNKQKRRNNKNHNHNTALQSPQILLHYGQTAYGDHKNSPNDTKAKAQ